MKHNNYVPDEELLAAFIPKESAQKLVQEYASLYHIFTRVSDEQLQQEKPGCGRFPWSRK